MSLVAVFETVNQPKTETNFRKSWISKYNIQVKYSDAIYDSEFS